MRAAALVRISPGQTYAHRGRDKRSRRVVAVGPEHRPCNAGNGRADVDGQGVLFVTDNGVQGRASLDAFIRWAGLASSANKRECRR